MDERKTNKIWSVEKEMRGKKENIEDMEKSRIQEKMLKCMRENNVKEKRKRENDKENKEKTKLTIS